MSKAAARGTIDKFESAVIVQKSGIDRTSPEIW